MIQITIGTRVLLYVMIVFDKSSLANLTVHDGSLESKFKFRVHWVVQSPDRAGNNARDKRVSNTDCQCQCQVQFASLYISYYLSVLGPPQSCQVI